MAGKIKFVKRGQSIAATIPEDDIAAHEWGSDAPDPVSKVRAQDLELPHEINVLYFNSGADYQQGTQKAERQTGSGVNTMTIALPVVMDDTKAKQVADVNLFNAWVQRTNYTLHLSRKWSKIEPTDVIDVVYNDVFLRMRVTKKDDAKPGIISLECVAEDSAIYTQSGVGAGSLNIPVQTVKIPVQTLAFYLDIPLLRDSDNDAGLYYAACGYRTGWSGCAVFKSNDNGSTYSSIFSLTNQAVIGNATTLLGDFYGGNIFDELNSVTVKLLSGTLSSTSELAVLNGSNYALLGNELIKFKNAELIAANTYRLTGLLRGRRGTEWAMGEHNIGDRFVLASTTTLRRIPLQSGDINLDRLFKSVSFGMTLQQTSAVAIRPTGVGLECYSPVQAGAGRNSSDDAIIQWTRRTRLDGEWRDYVDASLGEATESYEVDIYSDSTFTTVKRTLTSTTNSVTYSAANQVADFLINQNTLYVKIYQLSSVVGRGYPLTATLSMGRKSYFSTRWRILINDVFGAESYWPSRIAEIEMRGVVGGSNLCSGGTATASVNSANAYLAFDSNAGTYWEGNTAFPQWIEYQFLTAVDIVQFTMKAYFREYAPNDIRLQYYDGANWNNVYVAIGLTWTSDSETKTFTI